MPTITNNNVPLIHRKEWQMMTPAPTASVAGAFIVTDSKERDNLSLYVVSASVQYLYHHDEDAWVQVPSLALSGTFGAGACGARSRWSNTITANGGSTSTVTTATAITGLANGAMIRFLTGSQAGKEVTVTGVIINPGGTNTLQFTPALSGAIVNTDTFAIDKGRFFIMNSGTTAAGIFKSYDPLTGVATSLATANLPATWGTEGRLVATPSDDAMTPITVADIFSSTTIGTTGKTWATNQWTNSQVRITSGLGIGQVRTISSNTATTLTVPAWTTTPNATSNFVIEPNDDFLYLIGNNAVTMYRYSISGNTWTVMAPTTARGGAMVAGGGANFVGKTGDANWADETNIKDGRYIYSFRGGGSSALDRFDIAGGTAGAGAWQNIAYPNIAETFTTGSSFGIKGRYIYCRKDATHRYFKFSLRGNYMEPLTTNLYPDGTALLGDKTWIKTYTESGVEKLTWLYSLRNSGTEVHRILLY